MKIKILNRLNRDSQLTYLYCKYHFIYLFKKSKKNILESFYRI